VLADYIADDYQLGRTLHGLGLKNVISEVVVDTHLSGASWSEVWKHQLRWARTIRVSRFGGYIGLPVTHASLWALVAALAGQWWIAGALLTLRLAMALTAGWGVLRSKDVLLYWFLIPLRDLWGTAVWAAGLFGSTVEWRDLKLKLDRHGRILR
jgi:ceramide glucosyltransferase